MSDATTLIRHATKKENQRIDDGVICTNWDRFIRFMR
jgi:hypothetical protein